MGLNLILDRIIISIIRGHLMFQASLLKNFSKSFNAPDESKIKEAIEKLEAEVEVGIVEGKK